MINVHKQLRLALRLPSTVFPVTFARKYHTLSSPRIIYARDDAFRATELSFFVSTRRAEGRCRAKCLAVPPGFMRYRGLEFYSDLSIVTALPIQIVFRVYEPFSHGVVSPVPYTVDSPQASSPLSQKWYEEGWGKNEKNIALNFIELTASRYFFLLFRTILSVVFR